MTPSAFILTILRAHHRGRANAITRADLRSLLEDIGERMTDRDLRELYSELPVCTCSAGIFYPETTAELEECRRYYRKAALSLLGRWNRIAQAHPELINCNQMGLFE